MTSSYSVLVDEDNIDGAGTNCTYCRQEKPDCRPVCVVNREFIPALCDECYVELREAGRLDMERDREVFMPDAQ